LPGQLQGGQKDFFTFALFGNGGDVLSRYANLLALAGIYIGILGLIFAAGFSGINRESGAALGAGLLVWVIGSFFLVGAYFEARRPD
jgi:hypothetical protein